MPQDKPPIEESVSRRGFLAGSLAAAAAAATAAEAAAQAKPKAAAAPKKPPVKAPAAKPAKPTTAASPAEAPVATVNVGVIGLGPQGRELLAALGRAKGANVTAYCDTYPAFLRRAAEAAPKGAGIQDYRALLSRPDVQAVFIATPTHQHKEICLAAIQAGKHVYLESPMAHTIEEAREIGRAGKASKKVFQIGQQYRANPQHHHVYNFVKTNQMGQVTHGRGQWHKKTSWRRGAPTNEREQVINWRLDEKVSTGLAGEIGIHQLDISNWMLNKLPVAVDGHGAILLWDDGRKVADTVQCLLQYDNGVRYYFDSTLTNSYDGQYDIFLGSDAACLVRDARGWLFKEADAALLGWEVYAHKEKYGSETGLMLVADATKQLKEGKLPGQSQQDTDPGKTPVYFAVEQFLTCIRTGAKPDCGAVEGYQAAVTAITANQAIVKGTRISFQPEWFQL